MEAPVTSAMLAGIVCPLLVAQHLNGSSVTAKAGSFQRNRKEPAFARWC
ncbi:hypothetical protein CVCC1112_1750 [Paenarthrobacter nicotinovorans]|nr:hypothetical protein CVCC1112_1750 [Paenarthrobacter nicotinovorans]